MSERSYYTLLASLPNLPSHFDVERCPISRARLRERLKMVQPGDAAVIEQTTAFLIWDRQPVDRTDHDVAAKYNKLMAEISNATLREMIQIRMDTRTIIAAVRRRRAGLPPPRGVGQWVDHIRRNYDQPEFHLESHYPWIGELDQLLAAGDPQGAEWLLFGVAYRQWSRMAEKYTFCFEAVMLYLARWEIIDRWTSRDAEAGRQRFATIIAETMGDYANIF